MLSSSIRPPRLSSTQSASPRLFRRLRHALNLPAQPTVVSEDGTRSFRLRKDGTRMPLPPVMDPIVNSARMRWEQPKPEDDRENLTPFQRELVTNPYALALAGPIRQCSISRALLPKHFLIPFTSGLPKRREPDSTEPRGKAKLLPAIHFDPDQACSYAVASDEVIGLLQGSRKKKQNRWEVLLSEGMLRTVALKMGKKIPDKLKDDWELGCEDVKEEIRERFGQVVLRFLKRALKEEEELVVPLPVECIDYERIAAILCLGDEGSVELDHPGKEHYKLRGVLNEKQIEQLRIELDLSEETRRLALIKHVQTARILVSLNKLRNYIRPAVYYPNLNCTTSQISVPRNTAP